VRMKKWMGVLGMAAFMAVGIPGNAGSGLSMTAQAAGSGEMAGNVRVFDQADLFLEEEEKELQQAYGVISPRKVNLNIDGAAVTAVRCDIQAYYAVLATIEYDSGDVIYVSGLTKLASISDIVNLVESVSLS